MAIKAKHQERTVQREIEIRVAGVIPVDADMDKIIDKAISQVEYLVNAENHKLDHSVRVIIRQRQSD